MEALAHVHLNFRYNHLSAAGNQHIGAPLSRAPFLSLKNKFGRLRKVRMAAQTGVEVEHEESASKPGSLGQAVVVGAGPGGCVMALHLLHRGFHVHVFERRTMIDESKLKGDLRSYPILLTKRGIKAIEAAGLELPSSLMKHQVGNCTHQPSGKKIKMDYYSGPGIQSSIASRNALVAFLQQSLLERDSENLTLYFGWEVSKIEDTKSTAKFCRNQKYTSEAENTVDGKNKLDEIEVEFDLLIGADGVSSKVRSELLRLDGICSSASDNPKNSHITLDFIDNPRMYKSFYIRPSLARKSTFIVDHDRVQTWRTLNMMLINVADGSFWGGSLNEELINASSPTDVEKIFRDKAPDVLDLLLHENPNFAEEFWRQPKMKGGGAVLLSKFHHKNIVLIGDAAHAMFPTYGTGCNVALEDCLIFNNILRELTPSDGSKFPYHLATAEFTKRRIEDAHAIVEMNTNFLLFPRNFLGIIQKVFLRALHKWFPKVFRPTAHDLLWTETPFSEIKARKNQEDIFFYSIITVFFLLIALSCIILVKKLIL